jgi:hypothetical protein
VEIGRASEPIDDSVDDFEMEKPASPQLGLVMKRKKRKTPSASKARRRMTGGKRGDGHRRRRPIRRPNPATLHIGTPDKNLTGVGGLPAFGTYVQKLGVDKELYIKFNRLKTDPNVVYPMGAQLRLLTDAFAVGETRVFGVEGLAADPLFSYLAGGVVPSIDTLYDDLDRFDEQALSDLEMLMATQGLSRLRSLRGTYVHMDVDTTVMPVDGRHEGALPGPNPRYHGRPSFHPLLARIAETGMIVGAQLRPGNTGFGGDDVPTLRGWVTRARDALRRGSSLCVRVDAAGDCAELLQMLHDEHVFYVVKANVSTNLSAMVARQMHWKTVDVDADGRPTRQIAEIPFVRRVWQQLDVPVRVIVVRSRERHGKQLPLLEDAGWTFQVFLTNRVDDADDIAWDYDPRAGIEPLIADLKGAWGIGHASRHGFAANHAVLLLKLLSYNLLERYATYTHPTLPRWRTPWRRRTLLVVPGRISRSGGIRRLHLPPGSPLSHPRLE